MADSKTTKKLLANALKELLSETSFQKITISDICNRCNMSRKSFYYHFKDKYDLVNWIFESEYLSSHPLDDDTATSVNDARWDLLENLCWYFYSNIQFYSKIFRVKGQNCFADYIRDLIKPVLEERVQTITNEKKSISFCSEFYADAFLSALERWIIEYNTIAPNELINLLKHCVENTSLKDSF